MAECDVLPNLSICRTPDTVDWTATVDENDLQEQRDEVLALQSIYEGSDEDRIQVLAEPDKNGQGLYEIQFTVPVHMPAENCQVDIWFPTQAGEQGTDGNKMEDSDTQGGKREDGGARALTPPPYVSRTVTLERSLSGKCWTGSFQVKYLSPLSLHVTFPPHYPSQDPPSFTLSCIWLSAVQLGALCQQLDTLWEANLHTPVIFTWIDWLENEALSCLGITDSIVLVPAGGDGGGGSSDTVDNDDDRAVPDSWDLGQAVHEMLQYSNNREAVEFCKSMQECCLCFDEKPGTQFFRLFPCKHHFCFDCLAAHCSLHVTDGTVQMLTCPGYDCKSSIQPDVLQTVLSPELSARWEKLSLQRTLDEMEDIVYCPRCQSAVIREQEVTLNLGHCLVCCYTFCTSCEQPWHQGSACQSELERLEEQGCRVQPRDEAARKRYEELKERAVENAKTEMVIKDRTVRCPKCHVPIEKIAGCNKMTCQCGQSFCWLCKKAVQDYSHFQSSGCSLTTNIERRMPVNARLPPDAYLWMLARRDQMPDGKERTMRCVTCKQDNLKSDNNNHLRCWNCKAHLCFVCRARISGNIAHHFSTRGCPQHS